MPVRSAIARSCDRNSTLSSSCRRQAVQHGRGAEDMTGPRWSSVSGVRNTYFNHFDRDSRRYEGTHDVRDCGARPRGASICVLAGGQPAHTTYSGTDASQSMSDQARGSHDSYRPHRLQPAPAQIGAIEHRDGRVPRRSPGRHRPISYGPHRRPLRLRADCRRADARPARRRDASVPSTAATLSFKAGIGHFFDKLPLNAADFARQQSRRISDYGPARPGRQLQLR